MVEFPPGGLGLGAVGSVAAFNAPAIVVPEFTKPLHTVDELIDPVPPAQMVTPVVTGGGAKTKKEVALKPVAALLDTLIGHELAPTGIVAVI